MGFVRKVVGGLTGANKQAPRVIEAKVRDAFKAGWEASSRNSMQGGATQNLRTCRRLRLKVDVSVRDFGAVGDGVTDDTLAIHRAIDFAQSGYEVLVPAGSYRVTSTLALR